MITGFVNSEREALVRLTVLGPTGEEADIEALVDTGSDGYLTLPPDLIEQLQLPWLQSGQAVLADGTDTVFDIHGGSIVWGSKPRRVLIDVIDAPPLIGMALLAEHGWHVERAARRRGRRLDDGAAHPASGADCGGVGARHAEPSTLRRSTGASIRATSPGAEPRPEQDSTGIMAAGGPTS